jgi:hypothetical protein
LLSGNTVVNGLRMDRVFDIASGVNVAIRKLSVAKAMAAAFAIWDYSPSIKRAFMKMRPPPFKVADFGLRWELRGRAKPKPSAKMQMAIFS